MNNFRFWSPTEFVFGKGTVSQVSALVKQWSGKLNTPPAKLKVLIHYGGRSAERSGLLTQIENSFQDNFIDYVKLGGAQPNPVDTLVYKGIDLCRRESVNFILAVGGGSAIDSAKAIAVGVPYAGDFWNFFDGSVTVNSSLPVATILTIPAAGSEGSEKSVITNTRLGLKRSAGTPYFRPVFSIMDPELTYTLPAFQTACGIADMMAHVMERYFSRTTGVEVTDRLCEGLLKSIIKEGAQAIKSPKDYNARANVMWAGTLAHNGICGVGREEDWASHRLEHELSAHYDVAHGAGLAVIFPTWMKYVYSSGVDKFVQFATRVFDVPESGSKNEIALRGIEALSSYFTSIGLPSNFRDLGIPTNEIDKLISTLRQNMGKTVGSYLPLDINDAERIYEIAAAG